jgi:hypothetical protein
MRKLAVWYLWWNLGNLGLMAVMASISLMAALWHLVLVTLYP